jgi:hypothetical protein
MHPVEVLICQVGEVQVLQPRSAKGAVCREIELLPPGVNEGAPLAVGIHLNDLMGGSHFARSVKRGQSYKEGTVRGEGHAVGQRRKVFGVDLGLAEGSILPDCDAQAVVPGGFQHIDCFLFQIDCGAVGQVDTGRHDLTSTVGADADKRSIGLGFRHLHQGGFSVACARVGNVEVALSVVTGKVG